MYMLGGLGQEYDSFVIPITSMQGCYSMPEITTLLLTHEARIEQHTHVESLNINMVVNKKGNEHGHQGSSGFQQVFGRGNNQGFNTNGRNGNNQTCGGRKGRGRGRGNVSGINQPIAVDDD
ncbi:hypothetical protein Ddye_015213 [Dipteronia dyeriana]|uniref:Uncharacterized protein n=1 Tax=Dipteronia dyeriana TaxID=168575 RepID=A0AAD9U505_9ROSI|nr:hypothetical protein Ddye_015213 [Dipteronia dyeriana]